MRMRRRLGQALASWTHTRILAVLISTFVIITASAVGTPVVLICSDFSLHRSVIGWENSRHFHIQREANLKPIVTCAYAQKNNALFYSLAFSRAWHWWHAIVSNSDGLTLFTFVVIGRSNCSALILVLWHSIEIRLIIIITVIIIF